MRDEYDRSDRREHEGRDERRPRRARRRYDEDREPRKSNEGVSVLGIIALVKGVLALAASLIPCLGMFAIFAAAFALVLAVASVLIARHARHGMGVPVAATVVSGSAVAFSLMWLAVAGAMFRGGEDRAAVRPAQQLFPAPPAMAPPKQLPLPPMRATPKTPADTKADDEQFQKQLLEDLAKDRIKEAIRNGPGLPVTAAKLEADYNANVVAAELRYKDKVLAVTGKVIRVVRDEKKSVYTLELETDAPTKTVSCDFTEQSKHPLASVERGQQVKVRGLCAGHANEFVKLKDCVVAK